MGLKKGRGTLRFDRQCVLYAVEENVPELVKIFQLQGDNEITEDDIIDRAALRIDHWGLFNSETGSCYHCGGDQPSNSLCRCYSSVRISVLNIWEIVKDYDDKRVVDNYLCPDCYKEAEVQAYVVKKALITRKVYRPPSWCMDCFNAKKPQQHRPTLGDSVKPSAKESMQRAVASAQPTGKS